MRHSRALVIAGIGRLVDASLASRGFRRAAGSLRCLRHWKSAEQEIDLTLVSRPAYHPSATYHIQVGFRIELPDLEAQFRQIGVREVASRPLPTVAGSYELLTPQPTPMIYLESGSAVDGPLLLLRDLLLEHIVPFLDGLGTASDFVDMYREGRATRPPGWRGVHAFVGEYIYARIAYAALELERPDTARLVAETELGSAAARATYRPLLDLIDRSTGDRLP